MKGTKFSVLCVGYVSVSPKLWWCGNAQPRMYSLFFSILEPILLQNYQLDILHHCLGQNLPPFAKVFRYFWVLSIAPESPGDETAKISIHLLWLPIFEVTLLLNFRLDFANVDSKWHASTFKTLLNCIFGKFCLHPKFDRAKTPKCRFMIAFFSKFKQDSLRNYRLDFHHPGSNGTFSNDKMLLQKQFLSFSLCVENRVNESAKKCQQNGCFSETEQPFLEYRLNSFHQNLNWQNSISKGLFNKENLLTWFFSFQGNLCKAKRQK